ncbi:NYN domain-containing protein [Micromonospora tarensis]|uniref:NYN domain-containing protein n=1 Tax=Micromonospora tarensis TaxID=2806100 RepID=A0ABS1YAI6_9ACTN|nr:NYN domain-containing protein [Micromonospora tarensis]MBM0274415.1 NYN domain-containing protein [Micromonospora tarensis]
MTRGHPHRLVVPADAAATAQPGVRRRWWSNWPWFAGYAAAAWSACYGALGLFWALGGAGFPFGEGDPESEEVLILDGARSAVASPIIVALGVIGVLVGVLMARGIGRGALRWVLLTFGWTVAACLCLIIPDYRLLMLLTRIPFIIVSPIFGMPGGNSVGAFLPWPRLNLLVIVIGGLLWGMAATAYQRRTSDVCDVCGRADSASPNWTSPGQALRWGRWAVWVAFTIPCLYAATRIAWAVGWPLGIPRDFYEENKHSGMFLGGLLIALMAIGGAVLTLGLVQRWGEIYPRWIWFKAGKRVPPLLAIIPATIVAVFIIPAGIMEIRMDAIRGLKPEAWAMTWPAWLWPLWGFALGAATYAYHLRRRTAVCPVCGRGETRPAGQAQPVSTEARTRSVEAERA